MKNYFLSFFSLAIISCTVLKPTEAQPPAVLAINAATIKNTKGRIAQKDETYTTAYKQLLKDADKALKEEPHSVMEKKHLPPSGDKHDYMSLAPYHWPDPSKPDGLPYIRKDGQTNPEVKEYLDKEYMPKMCEQVYTLALAYYFSEDERYGDHAAKLLRVWYLNPETRMNPNMNYAQAIKGVNEGRGAGLIDARHYIKVVDAIGLLKNSRAWKKEDQEGMKQWFSQFLSWMQTSKNGLQELKAENNHGTWYDAMRLSFALFTGNTDLAKQIIANATERLDKQMDDEGKFPKEMERTIALHYNVFNLEAFFHIASMAEKTGFDFWKYSSPSGKSLKKGFDFLRPFLMQEKEWIGQQIKDFNFEDGFPILLTGSNKFNCKKCKDVVKHLAGEKGERLRLNLLY